MPERRVLFVSKELIAADLAYQLVKEGCAVKLCIENEDDRDCFNGMVEKTTNWEAELYWVGKEGLIVFDDVGYGTTQDRLRGEGFNVFGGSTEGDRLEMDREYGQKILRDVGVLNDTNFETYHFKTISAAIAYIEANPHAWVLKQEQHNSFQTYIGVFDNGEDVISILQNLRESESEEFPTSIQRKVTGVEIAIGRFFNGSEWTGPIVFNREHKHFANSDVGPLGGETGTVMWYEPNDNNRLFKSTLEKLTPHLKHHKHIGYVDLNCIIEGSSIYPLEFTCRFGSSTNQLQSEIQTSPWFDFMMHASKGLQYSLEYKKGIGVNVALTVPPFPYVTNDDSLTQKGVEIYFSKNLGEEEKDHIHYEDVCVKDRTRYEIAGKAGYVLYITAVGKTVKDARTRVYEIIKKIHIPKMFYRTDIGVAFEKMEVKKLKKWKWI